MSAMYRARTQRVVAGWVVGMALGFLGAPAAAGQPGSERNPAAVAAAIDRALEQRLTTAGVPPSPVADDATFLRRVTLDLTGRIPTRKRAAAFLDSTDPEKRRKLVDDLLADREYGRHFATVWRNLIVRPDPVKTKSPRDQFTPWLAEQFNDNRGWQQIVSELLTAEGDIARNPATTFIVANSENFQPDAGRLAGTAARLFLGVQLRCAECHDHPFAPWTQADFWGTAAFFSRLHNTSRKGPPFIMTEAAEPGHDPGATAAITIPGTAGKAAGRSVAARFLRGKTPALGEGPLRPTFAAWVTAPDNPFFAPAFVNRLWAQLFGRGFVNPMDDFRDDNPPSHPILLARLADEFRNSGYDVKHLLRCITLSRAYQRGSQPLPANEKDRELFSHMAVKVLSPEAFFDSLTVVMAIDKSAKQPPGKVKSSLPLTPEYRQQFIRFFRAQGESADETAFSHGIPQFLKRLNGEPFNGGAPLIGQLMVAGAGPEQVIEALYLATLSRRPKSEELRLMSEYLSRRADREQGYAGVLWILLNSGEFILNH